MNIHSAAHFDHSYTGVCFSCGARFGNCPHTQQPDTAVMVAKEPRAKYKTRWTDADDALLKELWTGGETQAYIAKCLDRPTTSIASRISSQGLRRGVTPVDTQKIMDLHQGGYRASEIAKAVGHSSQKVAAIIKAKTW